MALSKQHYIKIGQILCEKGASNPLISAMADYFEGDNPNFKGPKFLHFVKKCQVDRGLGSHRRGRR